MLAAHGAEVSGSRRHACLTGAIIDKALRTVPRSFKLYDVLGNETHDFAGERVYVTPGSAAINILDGRTGEMRKPTTEDYVRFVKLTSRLLQYQTASIESNPAAMPRMDPF